MPASRSAGAPGRQRDIGRRRQVEDRRLPAIHVAVGYRVNPPARLTLENVGATQLHVVSVELKDGVRPGNV